MTADLTRISHGIWRPPEVASDEMGRIGALLGGCAPGAVVCGISAARLHGLWLPERPREPLHVVVHPDQEAPSGRAHGRRSEVVTHRYLLRPDEIVLVNGVPATSEARTWIELARVLSVPDLIAAGDCILRGQTTLENLAASLATNRRRVGIVRARAALPFLDGRSRSRPESHLRYAVVSSGLPKPNVNQPIFNALGEWLAEPDLSYDDVRLAIEYNGADHADVRRMRRDITRELDALHRGGWLTVTFGPVEVFRRPDVTVATIAQLRRERAVATR